MHRNAWSPSPECALVPEQSSSGTRSSVTKLLLEHPHLTEDELVAVGLKHLHQTDGPKKQQVRDFGVDDSSEDRFSDEQILECLANAFGNRWANNGDHRLMNDRDAAFNKKTIRISSG